MQNTILTLRIFFFALCLLGSALIAYSNPDMNVMLVFGVGIGISLLVILIDVYLKGFSLSGFTALTFGLAIGAFFSHLINSSILFEPLKENFEHILYMVRLVITLVLMYLGAVIALRGRDEFYLVIPYVRFDSRHSEHSVVILDTGALIDGRIVEICRGKWLNFGIVIPTFVLQELQGIADSSDTRKKERGRKGLRAINDLKSMHWLDIRIHEVDMKDNEKVDDKLITLSKSMRARLLTTDYNLAQLAQFHGVEWLNLNELSQALIPDIDIGQTLNIELVKEGKEPNQAVGYLSDGSMVVVNDARNHLGKKIVVEISSIIPSAGGKMIFADIVNGEV